MWRPQRLSYLPAGVLAIEAVARGPTKPTALPPPQPCQFWEFATSLLFLSGSVLSPIGLGRSHFQIATLMISLNPGSLLTIPFGTPAIYLL